MLSTSKPQSQRKLDETASSRCCADTGELLCYRLPPLFARQSLFRLRFCQQLMNRAISEAIENKASFRHIEEPSGGIKDLTAPFKEYPAGDGE
ncbi:hypothetical protein CH63R_09151 [Colletotrichum higginsianum IMI 349063]|uniref:Uncharacterized protein n=1 Tax=Colletotrichum higginsianum (strain IMI 349063) TaxID=759273 RepID=A0A1B7Y6F8_COLHI|nr:hypothetical protein CH63R_09151 [Colletotrichum higginsianum IMI 349063]OBR07630.1 hypothetical protein CH63R_09151 [Colletotrichum higginsianum IMI 349063]